VSSGTRAAAAAAISRARRHGNPGTPLIQRCREGHVLRCAEDVPRRKIPGRQQRQRVLARERGNLCIDCQRSGHKGRQVLADGCRRELLSAVIGEKACRPRGCVSQGQARGGATGGIAGGTVVAYQAPTLAGAGA
jgi:hypothetical protein